LSLWSADEGSLLLWNLILAGYIAAVAFRFRKRKPETFPWAMAVMFAVSIFYLTLVLGPTRPFATLASVPSDGRGPLPLLQNHPAMDPGGVDLPGGRADPRRVVVLRGPRLGRVLGLGPRRERGPASLAHGHGVPPLRGDPGAQRHAQGVEPVADRGDVRADHV